MFFKRKKKKEQNKKMKQEHVKRNNHCITNDMLFHQIRLILIRVMETMIVVVIYLPAHHIFEEGVFCRKTIKRVIRFDGLFCFYNLFFSQCA
ncbi:hypothetical protein COF09_31865 [Bacillus toyonensis]|nr:hypothetical protein COF09_31865 [Bacillus toyonensis]